MTTSEDTLPNENRIILLGLFAAFLSLVLLAVSDLVAAIPRWLVGRVVGALVVVLGVAAPQLYLAHRGVPPATSRRGVAALVLAWAVWSVLRPSVGVSAAMAAALAVLGAEVAYEVYAGYREATARGAA